MGNTDNKYSGFPVEAYCREARDLTRKVDIESVSPEQNLLSWATCLDVKEITYERILQAIAASFEIGRMYERHKLGEDEP